MSNELKHADVIIHMAKHGFESVEYRPPHLDYWCKNISSSCNPITHSQYDWRIKPATITYSVTVPEPMRGKPDSEQFYFVIGQSGVHTYKWTGSIADINITSSRIFWDTEAKAQAAFDALFGPLRAVK